MFFNLDGPGISDPCEKEPTDAIGHVDIQQREDITQSAQVIYQCVICFGSDSVFQIC